MNQHVNKVSMMIYAKKHMQLMQEVERAKYIKEFLNDKPAKQSFVSRLFGKTCK